jgi:hypothetical protein
MACNTLANRYEPLGDARLNTVTLIGMETTPKAIVDAESYADMSTVVTISA